MREIIILYEMKAPAEQECKYQ